MKPKNCKSFLRTIVVLKEMLQAELLSAILIYSGGLQHKKDEKNGYTDIDMWNTHLLPEPDYGRAMY